LGKMTIASKLLTNRRVRQAAVELLKNPRADKRALAAKLITNRRVREGAVELLKDSSVRAMLLQQATQRFRRPWNARKSAWFPSASTPEKRIAAPRHPCACSWCSPSHAGRGSFSSFGGVDAFPLLPATLYDTWL
jgi:hypothetical protein